MYSRLITPERIHHWGEEDLLEATEQDRARIVQAAPVRRLQQKTQVFPLDVKASVRSRLTHSLEVQETAARSAAAFWRPCRRGRCEGPSSIWWRCPACCTTSATRRSVTLASR